MKQCRSWALPGFPPWSQEKVLSTLPTNKCLMNCFVLDSKYLWIINLENTKTFTYLILEYFCYERWWVFETSFWWLVPFKRWITKCYHINKHWFNRVKAAQLFTANPHHRTTTQYLIHHYGKKNAHGVWTTFWRNKGEKAENGSKYYSKIQRFQFFVLVMNPSIHINSIDSTIHHQILMKLCLLQQNEFDIIVA